MSQQILVPASAAVKPRKKIRIRPMEERDIPSVVTIEKASFEYYWTATDFLRCATSKCHTALVAENEAGEIVAYIIYVRAKLPRNMSMQLYAELHNFAVAPTARKQGIGTQLIDELVKTLLGEQFKGFYMMVRETNVTAQVFFRTNGLQAEYTTPNHYKEIEEDGCMMMRHFAEA